MTLFVIAALFAVALAWITYRYRVESRPAPVTVEDAARSAYAGGIGPEWDHLIARTGEADRNA